MELAPELSSAPVPLARGRRVPGPPGGGRRLPGGPCPRRSARAAAHELGADDDRLQRTACRTGIAAPPVQRTNDCSGHVSAASSTRRGSISGLRSPRGRDRGPLGGSVLGAVVGYVGGWIDELAMGSDGRLPGVPGLRARPRRRDDARHEHDRADRRARAGRNAGLRPADAGRRARRARAGLGGGGAGRGPQRVTVLFRQVVPNSLRPVYVLAPLNCNLTGSPSSAWPSSIPTAEWGGDDRDGLEQGPCVRRPVVDVGDPGPVLFVAVLCFNLLSEGCICSPTDEPARALRSLGDGRRGRPARRCVSDVDLAVEHGEVVGLVGESGGGKTMIARATSPAAPRAHASGVRGSRPRVLTGRRAAPPPPRRGRRGVLPEPAPCARPVRPVGNQLADRLRHRGADGAESVGRRCRSSRRSGCATPRRSAPTRTSCRAGWPTGDDRARARAGRHLLIADEPTTALDVTLQAESSSCSAPSRTSRNRGGAARLPRPGGDRRVLRPASVVLYAGTVVEEGATGTCSPPSPPVHADAARAAPDARGGPAGRSAGRCRARYGAHGVPVRPAVPASATCRRRPALVATAMRLPLGVRHGPSLLRAADGDPCGARRRSVTAPCRRPPARPRRCCGSRTSLSTTAAASAPRPSAARLSISRRPRRDDRRRRRERVRARPRSARVLMGLVPPIERGGRGRRHRRRRALGAGRAPTLPRRIQMVFQDPVGSLSPRRTAGQAIREPMRLHRRTAAERTAARPARRACRPRPVDPRPPSAPAVRRPGAARRHRPRARWSTPPSSSSTSRPRRST